MSELTWTGTIDEITLGNSLRPLFPVQGEDPKFEVTYQIKTDDDFILVFNKVITGRLFYLSPPDYKSDLIDFKAPLKMAYNNQGDRVDVRGTIRKIKRGKVIINCTSIIEVKFVPPEVWVEPYILLVEKDS